MHEAGLAARFLTVALEEAASRGAARITVVGARIGELHGVIDRHLTEFFEAMTRGTAADGARLVIERVRAGAACRSCGEAFQDYPQTRLCPSCGAGGPEITAGLELEIAWMEIT